MTYLQVDGISKSFGETVAVTDVTIGVDHGESLLLLGPSGCGKTALLQVLAGLESPDSSSIEIAAERLNRLGQDQSLRHTRGDSPTALSLTWGLSI